MVAATPIPNDQTLASLAGELTILLGRFMLPDLSEHACQVSQLSVDGAVFSASFLPQPGVTIVAYIDGIGRVQGHIEGPAGNGFAVAFSHAGARRGRFEKRLKRLLEPGVGPSAPERRRYDRDEPREATSQIALADGRSYPCEVIDVSLTGAAVKTEVAPTLGTQVMVGRMRGRVVRHLEHGVAIEFVSQQTGEERSTSNRLPSTTGIDVNPHG